MFGRAFTILELMLAIAVLVAIGAVVVPVLTNRAPEASFRESVAQLDSAVALARARSRQEGTALMLVARSREHAGDMLVSRALTTGRARSEFEGETDDSVAVSLDPGADSMIGGGAAGRFAPDQEGSERVLLRLDAGLHIQAQPPEATDAPGAGMPGPTEMAGMDDGRFADARSFDAGAMFEGAAPGGSEVGAEVILGVVLPDGSVLSTGPRYLVSEGSAGRAVALRIAHWTGRVTAEAIPSGTDLPEDEFQQEEAPALRESGKRADAAQPGRDPGGGP